MATYKSEQTYPDKGYGANYDEYQNSSDAASQDRVHTVSDITPAEESRIKRKIDLRLVVLVGFMYCVSLMDRTNTANAKAAGMGYTINDPKYANNPEKNRINNEFQGLDLVGFRYNILSLVFFPTYIVFQIPSTVIVRALGPRLHLSAITVAWGAVMIGMAFVHEWTTMAAMRVLLGILEAGFFPSCVYLLSTWYTRYDMGKRYSLFYILGCVASAFAGLLAYGLQGLHTKAGLSGWRWIFLVEGILTVVIAMVGAALLVGFPDHWTPKWHFLTEREVKWVIEKVEADRADTKPEPFSIGSYLKGGLDPTIWGYAMIFFDTTTISYALAYFMPDILQNNMKYSPRDTQIMSAPPYVFAGVIMFMCGFLGDKFKIRGPLIVFNMALCLIGLPLIGWTTNPKIKYFGIFLVTAGANANVPTVMTYQANNIRGQWKRALCSATLVGFGGIGGISGSLVFRSQDAKGGYKPGLYACMTCAALNIVIVGLLTLKFLHANRKANAGTAMIGGSRDFRYTI